MSINKIDAGMVQKMFLAGAKALEAKKEYINELNVFPVPDGDTGTNMTMTIMSAAKEVSMLKNLEKQSLAVLYVAQEETPVLSFLRSFEVLSNRSKAMMN